MYFVCSAAKTIKFTITYKLLSKEHEVTVADSHDLVSDRLHDRMSTDLFR